MLPAKEGTVFLSPLLTIILGTLLSLAVFLFKIASAVLFLAAPTGPGQPSQPSLVSLRSPLQVGYGSQVPSTEHRELISFPVVQSKVHLVLRNPWAQ